MEKVNVVKKLIEVTSAMAKKLKDWEKSHGPKYTLKKKERTVSEEGLKALGYI